MIRSYEELEVYQLSYKLAMEIFHLCKKIPKEEMYSLTSQVTRSSRSISSNIAEGWAKRNYINVFKRHLIDALGSNAETKNWIRFANDCQYIDEKEHKYFTDKTDQIGKMLTKLHENWRKPRDKASNIQPPTSNLQHPA